jgi:hypothetical protein
VPALVCVSPCCILCGRQCSGRQHPPRMLTRGLPVGMHAEDNRLVFGTDPTKLDGCNPTATPFPAGE